MTTNDFGQSNAPDGTFTAVDAGLWNSCGVRTDGTVTCWGDNSDGQSDAPDGTFSAVSAGWRHTCGLRTNGTITCWGSNEWLGSHGGQSDAPDGTFSAVSVGNGHSCGMRTDGRVECWGANTGNRGHSFRAGRCTRWGLHFGKHQSVEYLRATRRRHHHVLGERNIDGQADAPGWPFIALSSSQSPYVRPARRRVPHMLGRQHPQPDRRGGGNLQRGGRRDTGIPARCAPTAPLLAGAATNSTTAGTRDSLTRPPERSSRFQLALSIRAHSTQTEQSPAGAATSSVRPV